MKGITSTVLTESQSTELERPYIHLQLGDGTPAVLPMKYAQEVLKIPSRRITAIPNLPSCILGLINQRSRVFWVVDLSQMLDRKPVERNLQEFELAIIRVNNIPLGLITHQIKGVHRLSLEAIQSPVGNVAPGLVPYLQGCCFLQDKILLVLDAEAIVNSPLLKST